MLLLYLTYKELKPDIVTKVSLEEVVSLYLTYKELKLPTITKFRTLFIVVCCTLLIRN